MNESKQQHDDMKLVCRSAVGRPGDECPHDPQDREWFARHPHRVGRIRELEDGRVSEAASGKPDELRERFAGRMAVIAVRDSHPLRGVYYFSLPNDITLAAADCDMVALALAAHGDHQCYLGWELARAEYELAGAKAEGRIN